jgi:hypothetical protein
MAASAAERIRHYNRMLIWQHKFVGGTVLRGYGLNTRTFSWEEGKTIRAWGADYTPDLDPGPLWINRLMVGPDYDAELGVPGNAACEAWLGIARRLGKATTHITHYEFGTGAARFIKPYIAVGEYELNMPLAAVTHEHLQGGLGSWRGFFPNIPQGTLAIEDAENLAVALQSAASHVFAQT